MFEGFDLDRFKNMKPPSDNSFDTMQEVKSLANIPLNRSTVSAHDNIDKAFEQVAIKHGIKNYSPKLVKRLSKKSAKKILKLKHYFNRPRPKVMAKRLGIKMKDIEMPSMNTPSYPSGHSVQGILISKVLADKHPQAAKDFLRLGKNISDSRRIARAHYKSDSKMGEALGEAMYQHIKNKV